MGQAECRCFQGSFRFDEVVTTILGQDQDFAEVSLKRCKACDRVWLHYFYENEAFEKSGRWFCGWLNPERKDWTIAGVNNAREILESLDWYFAGGSYYDGKVSRTSGKIIIP